MNITNASNNMLAQPLSGANLRVFKNRGSELPLTKALELFVYGFELLIRLMLSMHYAQRRWLLLQSNKTF